jgi:hypothetical protein
MLFYKGNVRTLLLAVFKYPNAQTTTVLFSMPIWNFRCVMLIQLQLEDSFLQPQERGWWWVRINLLTARYKFFGTKTN